MTPQEILSVIVRFHQTNTYKDGQKYINDIVKKNMYNLHAQQPTQEKPDDNPSRNDGDGAHPS
jgi:hypothetical protein